MNQELHAYVVSLSWSSGMMSLVPVVSGGGAEHASAIAVAAAMRDQPIPEGMLAGVQVREIQIEWLRAAVRMIETGSVESAPIVRLVGHGSAELDQDAAKLVAMGQDPGPTLADFPPKPPAA